MIEVKDICFTVGHVRILDMVSVQLAAGEILVLCGPNGAGKSTLLRMMSGESRPSAGSVLIKNRDVRAWNTKKLARVRAVLHQESFLTFPFRVHDVVLLGRFPYKTPEIDEEIIDMCLQKVGMFEMKDRKYTTLSGGEKQRVQLARVLAQLEEEGGGEKILMLDEPTSSLDLPHQESTLKIAAEYARSKNHCVVVVLHDLNLAAAWADKIIFMRRGRSCYEGTPQAVLTPENIEAIYGLRTHILAHPDTQRPLVIIDRGPSSNRLKEIIL